MLSLYLISNIIPVHLSQGTNDVAPVLVRMFLLPLFEQVSHTTLYIVRVVCFDDIQCVAIVI